MGWSVSEDLLCVADDGSVFVYDIHGAIKKTLTMGQVSQSFHLVLFIITEVDGVVYRRGFEIWTVLGVPPQDVVGNRISSIIRPGQHVIMSQFFFF